MIAEAGATTETGISTARHLLLFALLAVAAAGATLTATGGLDFPLYRDEHQFWSQARYFAERWPPGMDDLRGYPEPMTPLAFLLWGGLDVALGLGASAARALTLAFGLALLVLVGLRPRAGSTPLLAAVGLLAFPYTLPLSVHVYTDVPAAFFVTAGFALYLHGRPGASAAAFALAISTRQYMVVFPLAMAAAEIAPALLRRNRPPPRTLAPLLGAASLGAWVLFFGGLGPDAGLEKWPRHMAFADAGLVPAYGLHFLTCVGAYFVVPEFVLFRRWRWHSPAALFRQRNAALLLAVLVAFLVFPAPDVPMGALNRGLLFVLPPETLGAAGVVVRRSLFLLLAWLACIRFARFDLVFWILLGQFLVMLTAFEGWEKYNLPVIAALWYLRSLDDLEDPLPLRIGGQDRTGGREAG